MKGWQKKETLPNESETIRIVHLFETGIQKSVVEQVISYSIQISFFLAPLI